MVEKRLDYPDMVKGIGIILVILGHVTSIPGPLRIWISAYHMPVFFVLSGMMMGMKQDSFDDVKAILIHKARGILIPYFWFSLSYFILDIGNLYLEKIDFNTFVSNIISSLTFYGKAVLWFLPALFLTQMYFILLRRRFNGVLTCVTILVIVTVAYLCKLELDKLSLEYVDSLFVTTVINFFRTFVRAAIALPFVGLGYLIQALATSYDNAGKVKKNKFASAYNNPDVRAKIIMVIAGIILLVAVYYLGMINGCVDLHSIILGNVALYYITAILGSLGLIILCKGLPPIGIIKYYGKNSLIVMAAHLDYYILWASLVLSTKIVKICNTDNQVVFLGCVVIFVLLMSTIVIEGINRFFPFVMGKKRIVKERT